MVDSLLHPQALDRVVQVALVAVLLWFGTVLALPGDIFPLYPSYRVMARFASEETWAACMWAGAVVGAIGLSRRHHGVRIASLVILSASHTCIAVMFAWGAFPTTACGAYLIYAALGIVLVAREAAR